MEKLYPVASNKLILIKTNHLTYIKQRAAPKAGPL